jgi:hypothetical protein
MRTLLTALVLLSFALSGCWKQPAHSTWNTATGGEQYERLMWKAIQDKDWAQVERHLSPTFVGVNAEGQLLDRTGWIAYWKSSQPVNFSLGELTVQPEGADMKVTSVVHFQGGAEKPAGGPAGLRVISVWQQIKTRWALIATSITPIQSS